jgi:hypothetical protein
MAETFEEQHLDVLQNIEVVIVDFSREHPELLDYDVEGALDALIAGYTAELRGRTVRDRQRPGLRQPLMEEVRGMCEWLLGRSVPEEGLRPSRPHDPGEIVACLNKILKSVRRWTREGGRRGYIGFVQRYVL